MYLPESLTDGHDLYVEVHSLDLWSECLITSTFLGGILSDLKQVSFYLWGNRLAVADIAEGALNVFCC